jgi:hypothetical protein
MHSKRTVACVSKELFAQDEIFNEEEERLKQNVRNFYLA